MTKKTTFEVDQAWADYAAEKSDANRNRVMMHYSRLVKLHAEKMKKAMPAKVEVEDLVQVGQLGLMQAVERFDQSRGIKFETFAERRIRGEILDYLRANDWAPRQIRSRFSKLRVVTEQYTSGHQRKPTLEEYSKALGITQKEVRLWLAESLDINLVTSIDGMDKDERRSANLAAEIVDPAKNAQREDILQVVGELPEKLRGIVELYYFCEMPFHEIGEWFGLSESRICQLHKEAVAVLREKLEGFTLPWRNLKVY